MAPSKTQIHFHGPYRPQNWSLPDSVIYYIAKNPSNAKAWQKLIQSCKYYFTKNPVFVIDSLSICWQNMWKASLNGFQKDLAFANLPCKLWIINEISQPFNECSSKCISSIVPNIYKCDATILNLAGQIISYNEFLFLSTNVENIVLDCVTVKNENGTIVPLENLVKVLPKVYYINIDRSSSSITSNTVKELLKIPNFSKIDKIVLQDISETFDITMFFEHIKKCKYTKFFLKFSDTISDAYKNRVESIVDEIVSTKTYSYNPPYINFHGISQEKYRDMYSRQNYFM
uniref:Uncharacterized protein n=1 Tax=Panagrolaimus sp. PS1159 TaxID=55785 RepID=A0AC35FQY5_9BILA